MHSWALYTNIITYRRAPTWHDEQPSRTTFYRWRSTTWCDRGRAAGDRLMGRFVISRSPGWCTHDTIRMLGEADCKTRLFFWNTLEWWFILGIILLAGEVLRLVFCFSPLSIQIFLDLLNLLVSWSFRTGGVRSRLAQLCALGNWWIEVQAQSRQVPFLHRDNDQCCMSRKLTNQSKVLKCIVSKVS